MSSCLWLTTLDLGGNATPVVSDCFFVHPPPPNGSWQSCNAHIQLQMCLHQRVLIDNHLMCPQGSVCVCASCVSVLSVRQYEYKSSFQKWFQLLGVLFCLNSLAISAGSDERILVSSFALFAMCRLARCRCRSTPGATLAPQAQSTSWVWATD